MQVVSRCQLRPATYRRLTTGSPFSTKSKRNDAIGEAIERMRAQAQQAKQKVEDAAPAGAQQKLQQSWERIRSTVDKIKEKFESAVEKTVSPKFAAKAQQATDSVRSVFSKQFIEDVSGDLFGRKKQYGRKPPPSTMTSDMPTSDAREVVVVKEAESEFARRLRQLRERAEQTETYQKLQEKMSFLRKKVRASPLYQKGVEAQNRVGDKIEDARDAYDTTQNPLIWTVRDVTDSLLSESEQGAALAAIRRLDPNFSLAEFLEELEHFMIPTVVKAYLRADTEVLHDVCGGDALMFVNASVRQRQAQSAHFDERILDVSNVTFHDAITLESGEPVLVVTFQCQHVHCIRGPDGSILEGSDHDIRSSYYSWAVTRDHASERFNWRILDMQIQGIRALI